MKPIAIKKGGIFRGILFLTVIAGVVFVRSIAMCDTSSEPTDLSISDAVEDELHRDAGVQAQLIDVFTNNGVVTLTGSVDNLLSKQRAERIASMVKGVRSIVNIIKVSPPVFRSDDEIKDDIKEKLLLDPATDAFNISVSVKNNVATISGIVDSWQERKLSETVAKGVSGVKGIVNNVKVKQDEDRSDVDIKDDITETLRWDVLVDHALINVEVKNGNVVLTGTVGSLAEKMRAVEDAYATGVKNVTAEGLDVRMWARDPKLKGDKYKNISDDDIRKVLENALFYDPRVTSFKITETVDDGVVTLRGTVDNFEAKRSATRTASNTVGVKRVINRIKVRLSQPFDDKTIKSQIEKSFTLDPFLKSYNITVNIKNGVVDLFGSVGTIFEKNQAKDVASKINGVIAVNNYIIVPTINDLYLNDPYFNSETGALTVPRYLHPMLTPVKTDKQIKSDIKDEFFWSPFVNGDDIDVRVIHGIATLTGTVDSLTEYNAAVDNAYDGGAVIVNSELKVKR